jgi:hypothetical protein
MKPIGMDVHIFNHFCLVQPCQNCLNAVHHIWRQLPLILKKMMRSANPDVFFGETVGFGKKDELHGLYLGEFMSKICRDKDVFPVCRGPARNTIFFATSFLIWPSMARFKYIGI